MKQPQRCIHPHAHNFTETYYSRNELPDNWEELVDNITCNRIAQIGSDYCINHKDKETIKNLETREKELNERISSLVTKQVEYLNRIEEKRYQIDQLICEIDERNSLSIYDKFKYFIKTRIERW